MPSARRECHDSVANHYRSSEVLSSGEFEGEWRAWFGTTAEKLADVPVQARALPIRMPMKCAATVRTAGESSSEPKPETISYHNPDGRKFTREDLRREASSTISMRLEDFPIGSCVVVKRSAESDSDAPGFNTPFYVGQVLSVDAASEDSNAVVTKLTVHWRMPRFRTGFCNDMTKPLALVCVGMHEWSAVCETSCKKHRPSSNANTSKMIMELTPDMILETKIGLTPASKALSKKAKEQLVKSNPAWRDALMKD